MHICAYIYLYIYTDIRRRTLIIKSDAIFLIICKHPHTHTHTHPHEHSTSGSLEPVLTLQQHPPTSPTHSTHAHSTYGSLMRVLALQRPQLACPLLAPQQSHVPAILPLHARPQYSVRGEGIHMSDIYMYIYIYMYTQCFGIRGVYVLKILCSYTHLCVRVRVRVNLYARQGNKCN